MRKKKKKIENGDGESNSLVIYIYSYRLFICIIFRLETTKIGHVLNDMI